MARFGVGGDEDGNEERSNNRRLPKKPRISNPIVNTRKRASASKSGDRAAAAAASKAGNPRSTPAAPQIPVVRESQPEKRKSFKRTCWPELSEDEPEEEGDEEEEEGGEEMEQQTAEARVNSTPNGNGMGTESVERRRDSPAPLSVTLTDPDVLDCPICLEPLNPPVYQCENGHISCEPCCIKILTYKCASCNWPIGYNRCRAIEKVLDSVNISCPNMQYGCKVRALTPTAVIPACPTPCTHTLPHNTRTHPSYSSLTMTSWFRWMIIRSMVEDTLFVLNRSIEHRGSLVNVVCVGPISSKRKFLYEVSARNGVSFVKLKTVAEMTPQWTGVQSPDGKYLLVPNDFMTSGGELKLELTIRRDRGLRLPGTRMD